MALLDAALISVLWMIFIVARDWQKWQAGARWAAQEEEKRQRMFAEDRALRQRMEGHAQEAVKMMREEQAKEQKVV